MNKKLFVMSMALALCLFFIGSVATASEYPVIVTDSAGKELSIEDPIETIIVLNSDAAEAVSILDDSDKIVGIVDTVQKKGYYFPDLVDREVVGTWKEFDYEKIGEIAKEHSNVLVISYTSKVSEVGEGLSPFGNVIVVGLDLYNSETLTDEMNTLGIILGQEDGAEIYNDWFQSKVDAVVSAVEGQNQPKVYIESSSAKGLGSLSTYGQGSALNEMIDLAGGQNAIVSDTSYPKIEWETVLEINPDVIIKLPSSSDQLGLGNVSEIESMALEIASRPGADNINAVKDDQIYVIYRDMHFGMDSPVGLTYWAKIFHPQVDLNPEEVYEEYLQMIGLNFPDENVFIYPSIV